MPAMRVPEEDSADQTMMGGALPAPAQPAEFGHYLSYTQNDTAARVTIPGAGITIGRAAPAELAIADPQISRQHCRIELQDGWAVLADLGSTNGTFVDGQKLLRPARLRAGSRINLGTFAMRYDRRELHEVAAEAEHHADLQRAVEYVRAILPPPLTHGPVLTEWCFTPSAKLGGDAFGYEYLSQTLFAGFLLDVSGHGIGSAMHAANVANALRRHGLPGVDFADPAQVVAGVNKMFPMEEHNGLMLTLWYFTYDLTSRTLRFASGGHHAALISSPANPVPAPLWIRGPAIGMLPDAKWNIGEAPVPPGGMVTLFSDGAFEIIGEAGKQWALEDFARLVATLRGPQTLYQAVRTAHGKPLEDDFSVVQLRFP